MKGIEKLFLHQTRWRNSVKHLFVEFQNSLGDQSERPEIESQQTESSYPRVRELVLGARQRGEFLPSELEALGKVLCELLSEKSCAEWLGFNDHGRPDTLPRVRPLAGLVRNPDWTDVENIHKLRIYRAAAFIDCLRPNVLDWQTPRIPDMEWVLKFIEVFTRSGVSVEDQTNLIEDVSRPQVPLKKIVQTTRGPRLELSPSELRYVWETRELSHEERAATWDNRTPKPFQPLGRPNLELYGDRKLRGAWCAAINRQLDKAEARYDPDSNRDERELN